MWRMRLAAPTVKVVLVPLWLVLLAGVARAGIEDGDRKFLHGDYAGAAAAYRRAKGKEAARAQVRLGRVLLRTGDLAEAEAVARKAARAAQRDVAADAEVLLGEVLFATGRTAEARATLQGVVRRHPDHLRARIQLGLVLRELGDLDAAEKLFHSFYDDWDAGKIDQKNAEQLMYVAMAARQLESFQDANDTFRDAVAADPYLLEANVEWGFLFLQKYAAGYAEQSFDEVLKIDPNHPDAHAGMARVKIEQNYDVRGALDHVAKALAANPHHAGALLTRAELEMDNHEWDAAKATITKVLEVNPRHLVARTMLAAIHWLADDVTAFEAERQKVFAQNPKYARFYHVVADFAVKAHRYVDAIELEEKAIRLDPKYYDALAGIGIGYLRLGEEKKGLEYLNRAFERDPFNVRAYNTLNLYDEAIAKKYELFASGKHLRFRMMKEERPLLERYAPRLLERAFADMVRRYGFLPKTPITVELFGDPQHYSVRTVGLPNLGALGVCFGQVITALSPANGNVNWGMILWHELAHVFALQLSRSRVPRWFTEGLAEYETILARPEWRRENDADLWLALEANALPSILQLDSRFLRARDMQDMVVAYHLSSVVVEFLATRWGFPKIVEALRLFGQGKDTATVVPAVTGLPVAGFDAEFRSYLEQRLAAYRGTFRVRLSADADLAALEKAAAAAPKDAGALADLALAYLGADENDKAHEAANRAIALDAKNRKALFVLAELALRGRDRTAARARLEALVSAGGDGYDARLRLGQLAIDEKDWAAAERELSRAKKLDPERSEPYALLAEMYFQNGREDDALRELERYAYLEQMEYGPVKKLVDKYAARRIWAKVREFGEMALLINPYDPDVHLALGEAYLALGRHDDAAWEFESALLCDPPLRRPAVAHLGLARASLAKKDRARARKALAEALRLEPTNADALELKKQLR